MGMLGGHSLHRGNRLRGEAGQELEPVGSEREVGSRAVAMQRRGRIPICLDLWGRFSVEYDLEGGNLSNPPAEWRIPAQSWRLRDQAGSSCPGQGKEGGLDRERRSSFPLAVPFTSLWPTVGPHGTLGDNHVELGWWHGDRWLRWHCQQLGTQCANSWNRRLKGHLCPLCPTPASFTPCCKNSTAR